MIVKTCQNSPQQTAQYASWCEIYLSQIEQNLIDAFQYLPEKTKFCAVLKADAYGHGIENLMPILLRHHISDIGITSNMEAQAVRQNGFQGNLMRLRTATMAEIEEGLAWQIQEQISSEQTAHILAEFFEKNNQSVDFHLSLNAGGMSRDGLELSTQAGKAECHRIIDLLGEKIVGICTHFPNNDPSELQNNIQRFQDDLAWVFKETALERDKITVHGGSTLTLLSGLDPATDMMRCGAVMYGVGLPDRAHHPSMSLKARVTNIGQFPQGSTIGYDRAMKLSRDSVLANISIGYANGYGRELCGKSGVLIRGHHVPILGKISMNTIVADITDIPQIMVGDEAVLFGPQETETISAKMIEQQSGTILADLFTDWGHRNPRILIR